MKELILSQELQNVLLVLWTIYLAYKSLKFILRRLKEEDTWYQPQNETDIFHDKMDSVGWHPANEYLIDNSGSESKWKKNPIIPGFAENEFLSNYDNGKYDHIRQW